MMDDKEERYKIYDRFGFLSRVGFHEGTKQLYSALKTCSMSHQKKLL